MCQIRPEADFQLEVEKQPFRFKKLLGITNWVRVEIRTANVKGPLSSSNTAQAINPPLSLS